MTTMFMFPGQGSQVLKMGLSLYQNYDTARLVFEEVDDALGYKLSDIIFGDDEAKLLITENTQPALMTVSIAVLRCLEKEKGKTANEMCNFVAGHSLGEYSALCCSGVLSLTDAAKLLQIRGKSMLEACNKNNGAMLALLGGDIALAEEICKKAGGVLVVANDNSTGQIVLSGTAEAVDKAVGLASEAGIKRAVKLNVQGAFHSPLMEYAQEKMLQKIHDVKFNEPKIPLFANVTAQLVKNSDEIKDLLIKQITSRVRWTETLFNAKEAGVTKMVELGSGKVLNGLAKRTIEGVELFSVEKPEDLNLVL